METSESKLLKVGILAAMMAVTLGMHYGWLIDPFFGHAPWTHAIHGRLCYIPIVVAAVWFGLRGGLAVATAISLLLVPYLLRVGRDPHNLAGELTEIVFYFAIALLSGALIDRELRARKKAHDARLQLERSQRLSLVGQIAAGMAHEIKNPLASIKGAVEILGDQTTPPSAKAEFSEIVIREIKRINRSVTDFLEFARPSEPNYRRTNLSDAVHGSIKQINTQALRAGIFVIGDIEPGLHVNGDPEKLHQVLLNLLVNALEASNEGGGIHVRLTRDEDSRFCLLTVEDEGAGIPDDQKDRVFEPFFSSKPSGTGLGLAIAETIVDRHGGTISIENRETRGARARVRLPLQEKE